MLFNSQIFVFAFLPIVWLCYFGLHRLKKHSAAKAVLFVASIVFYGYYNPIYILLLMGSIGVNYGIYRLLGCVTMAGETKINLRKMIMLLGVAINLGVLFYFKYFNFFLENMNAVLKTDFMLQNIFLPLGISFFTFQQLSFVIDAYKNETGKYSFLDYGVFVSFFPQLVAGPIVLHKDLIPQLSEQERFKPQMERMTVGLRYFVMGLFKKVMVADRFGSIVTAGHMYPFDRDALGTALVMLAYTIQIYFDFSGYSDMAIGLGKFFGIDIPINFDSPYKAVTIGDFWKRWHITMTRFFTQYLYIPLGGNRKGIVRTCLNVLIVFTLSGLWHGAAWNFVLWGMMHGIALVLYRIFKKFVDKVPKLLMGLCTFVFVNIAWTMFRVDVPGRAKRMVECLLTGGFSGDNTDLYTAFLGNKLELMLTNIMQTGSGLEGLALITTWVGLVLALLVIFLAPSSHRIANRKETTAWEGVVWAVMAFVCFISFTNVSVFLYFNF